MKFKKVHSMAVLCAIAGQNDTLSIGYVSPHRTTFVRPSKKIRFVVSARLVKKERARYVEVQESRAADQGIHLFDGIAFYEDNEPRYTKVWRTVWTMDHHEFVSVQLAAALMEWRWF